MISRMVDYFCGGSSKRIWERTTIGKSTRGIAIACACPRCKQESFKVFYSGALQSLLCCTCDWFSGVSMTGNKVAYNAVLTTEGVKI